MWTPDELGGMDCLSSLMASGSADCRIELLNPTIDLDGDGVFDSGRAAFGEHIVVATDVTGDRFANIVTSVGPDGTYTVWESMEPAASGTIPWRPGGGGLLA